VPVVGWLPGAVNTASEGEIVEALTGGWNTSNYIHFHFQIDNKNRATPFPRKKQHYLTLKGQDLSSRYFDKKDSVFGPRGAFFISEKVHPLTIFWLAWHWLTLYRRCGH